MPAHLRGLHLVTHFSSELLELEEDELGGFSLELEELEEEDEGLQHEQDEELEPDSHEVEEELTHSEQSHEPDEDVQLVQESATVVVFLVVGFLELV